MSAKFEKVLDSGRQIVVDLKRKQSDRCNISSSGGTQLLVPLRSSPGLSIHNLAKRRKLDGYMNKYSSCVPLSGKCLLKNYTNFKKSGILDRLMYYYNDEWNDFSQDIVAFVNKDLLIRKPVSEVEFNGNKMLLDFLHMMLSDMNSGLQQPIAWIDVSGKCFFPEIVSDCNELHNCYNEFAGGHDLLGAEPQGSNNANLHLEIEIHGLDDESSGESNAIVEQVESHENTALKYCNDDVNGCVKTSDVEVDVKCGDNLKIKGNTIPAHDPVTGSLDSDAVKGIFFKAISSSVVEIVEIFRCMSVTMESRLELFEKQVEITRRYRGNANIQYAWLPCSRGTVSTILKYGFGHYEPFKTQLLHGVGVHLIPTNGTHISVDNFDVDENDTRHMIFCRVIMGNMELVRCGSNQFHPSSEDFDSGVDSFQTPKHYVIWTMNMNSHILPEWVISFKMVSDVEGPVFGKETVDYPGFGTHYGPQAQISGRTYQARTPRCPWMPFSMLFAVLSGQVTSENMELVKTNYALFRNKKLSRDAFVRKLRVIVGDNLLKSAITSLQRKMSPNSHVDTT